MNKFLLLFGLLMVCCTTSSAQLGITWEVLAEVSFYEDAENQFGIIYTVPKFGDSPLAFEGKEIHIRGYYIPFNDDKDFFVLSKTPFSSCFFCGQAGPETVIEIWLKPGAKRDFKLDQQLTMKGILKLNRRDMAHMTYILEEAELME